MLASIEFVLLARLQHHFGVESREPFETTDEMPEEKPAHDEQGATDDEKAPAGDTGHVFIVELAPVLSQWIEIAQEIEGKEQIHHATDHKGPKEEERRLPQKPLVVGMIALLLHGLLDPVHVEDGVIIKEDIKERFPEFVRDEEERT